MAAVQEIVANALTLIRDRQGDVSPAEIAELFCLSERQSRFHLAKMTGKNLRTLCLEARLEPAYLGVVVAAQPFAIAESAAGKGATIMIEAERVNSKL